MRLDAVFKVLQGHQITDEDIYKSIGNIPILTASNDIKGYWDKAIVTQQDLPCITYPTKANTGETFIQREMFDANNTAVLIPLLGWRDKVALEWVSLKLAHVFLKVATSRDGVSYLNKDIVEAIDLQIPDKAMQEQQLHAYSRLGNIEAGCKAILQKIEQVSRLAPAFEYKRMQGRAVPVSDVFECVSGNSGLTEEYLYRIMNTVRGERRYMLLTGGTDVEDALLIPRCADPKDAAELITVHEGEGIHVVRKGQAGRIHYLPSGYYTLNDDAYILTLKRNYRLDVSLNWVVDTQRSLFSEYATKSDNGTWSKSAFFEHASLDIPDRQEQDAVTQLTKFVRDIESQFTELRAGIASLLEKELL